MMLEPADSFGAFVDEDDGEGELFDLPGTEYERLVYQVGVLTIPHWLMEGIANGVVIFRNGGCMVLVNRYFMYAPVGFYIIRSGKDFTIESPEQNQ